VVQVDKLGAQSQRALLIGKVQRRAVAKAAAPPIEATPHPVLQHRQLPEYRSAPSGSVFVQELEKQFGHQLLNLRGAEDKASRDSQ
jgi:hypothetical protein